MSEEKSGWKINLEWPLTDLHLAVLYLLLIVDVSFEEAFNRFMLWLKLFFYAGNFCHSFTFLWRTFHTEDVNIIFNSICILLDPFWFFYGLHKNTYTKIASKVNKNVQKTENLMDKKAICKKALNLLFPQCPPLLNSVFCSSVFYLLFEVLVVKPKKKKQSYINLLILFRFKILLWSFV